MIKVGMFILVSIMLNFALFSVDISVEQVAQEEGLTGYTDTFNYEDSHIKQFDLGNYTLDEDISSSLPSGNGDTDADPDSGSIFTDTFKAIKDWVLDTSGVRFLLDLLNVLPNTLKLILPSKFAAYGFALGYIWHIATVLAVIGWITGRVS